MPGDRSGPGEGGLTTGHAEFIREFRRSWSQTGTVLPLPVRD